MDHRLHIKHFVQGGTPSYCRTWAGFTYVAFIVDVFAQRIVGWHAATSMTTDLVMVPLRIALWDRGRQGQPFDAGQVIAHSDAGSQYTSIRYTNHLALEGISPSIGSVGDAYDNALMESINGLFKTECMRTSVFHEGPFKTIGDVEFATAGWVDCRGPSLDVVLGGTTTGGFIRVWGWSRRRSLSKSITLPSRLSRSPFRSGTEPGAVQSVWVRNHDGAGQVVICDLGEGGPIEVARHGRTTPGTPAIDDAHFPGHDPHKVPGDYRVRARSATERAFLDLGEGAAVWLKEAAAVGTERIHQKMAHAVELAALGTAGDVDWALGHAAAYGRFATGDLDSVLASKGRDATRHHASEDTSLAQGTSGWNLLGGKSSDAVDGEVMA